MSATLKRAYVWRHRKPRTWLRILRPRLILEPAWRARWPGIGCGQVRWVQSRAGQPWSLAVPSAQPGSFMWFFPGPEVHPPERLSWDPKEAEKMQPQTLDKCINFASAASGKAFDLVFPRPQCFRGGISQPLKLMSVHQERTDLLFRPDVNLLFTWPRELHAKNDPCHRAGCFCCCRTTSGTHSLMSVCHRLEQLPFRGAVPLE